MTMATPISTPKTDAKLSRDLRTLAAFIRIYCRGHHHQPLAPVAFKTLDSRVLSSKPLLLCPACSKLLHHAVVKRSHCPQNPKPACKDCPNPCYDKAYRVKIREVMRFSGWRLLLCGRIDLLFHLLRRPAHNGHANRPLTSHFRESAPAAPTLHGRPLPNFPAKPT